MKYMNAFQLNKIYDILVEFGGAAEFMRTTFIYHHLKDCTEWRFQGKFGFGGKYRSRTNTIDYYSEDQTEELDELCQKINDELSKVI